MPKQLHLAPPNLKPSAPRELRILVADDHAIVRQGIKQTLTDEFEKVVVAEARNAQEILNHVQKQAWDLAILDIALPDKNGLEVLKILKGQCPELPRMI